MAGVRRHGISAVLPDKEPVPGTMSTAIATHGTRGALTGKGLSAWAFLKRPSQPLGFGTEPPCAIILGEVAVWLLQSLIPQSEPGGSHSHVVTHITKMGRLRFLKSFLTRARPTA